MTVKNVRADWKTTYKKLVENNEVKELTEDREVDMAIGQLRVIQHKANELADFLMDLVVQNNNADIELPAWVQSKFSNAAHSVSAVHDYMIYGADDYEDKIDDKF
tara:strand:+ start:2881 stop:3195 length:315 start_codon:yes stop_codon:yes gene_type:complete